MRDHTAQGQRKVNHLFKADFFGERALLRDEPRCVAGRLGWAGLAPRCIVVVVVAAAVGLGLPACLPTTLSHLRPVSGLSRLSRLVKESWTPKGTRLAMAWLFVFLVGSVDCGGHAGRRTIYSWPLSTAWGVGQWLVDWLVGRSDGWHHPPLPGASTPQDGDSGGVHQPGHSHTPPPPTPTARQPSTVDAAALPFLHTPVHLHRDAPPAAVMAHTSHTAPSCNAPSRIAPCAGWRRWRRTPSSFASR